MSEPLSDEQVRSIERQWKAYCGDTENGIEQPDWSEDAAEFDYGTTLYTEQLIATIDALRASLAEAEARADEAREVMGKTGKLELPSIAEAEKDRVTVLIAPPECTGIAASWCPNCGDCTCERPEDGGWIPDLTEYNCPLHGPDSIHAEA